MIDIPTPLKQKKKTFCDLRLFITTNEYLYIFKMYITLQIFSILQTLSAQYAKLSQEMFVKYKKTPN